MDPTLLVASGYGEFHPVAPNDTPDGRALNRRIEIVLTASIEAMPPQQVGKPATQAKPGSRGARP